MKEAFFLYPMAKTGGCGGAACVPALMGVNHRFSIGIWKNDDDTVVLPTLGPEIDA